MLAFLRLYFCHLCFCCSLNSKWPVPLLKYQVAVPRLWWKVVALAGLVLPQHLHLPYFTVLSPYFKDSSYFSDNFTINIFYFSCLWFELTWKKSGVLLVLWSLSISWQVLSRCWCFARVLSRWISLFSSCYLILCSWLFIPVFSKNISFCHHIPRFLHALFVF